MAHSFRMVKSYSKGQLTQSQQGDSAFCELWAVGCGFWVVRRDGQEERYGSCCRGYFAKDICVV